MTTPTASLAPAHVDEFDHTLEDQLVIRCYACRAWNGSIHLVISNREVIGHTVLLDDRLVNKGKPKDGMPRYGLPDRVRRGQGDRRLPCTSPVLPGEKYNGSRTCPASVDAWGMQGHPDPSSP